MSYEDISSNSKDHAFLGGSNYHWLNYTPEKLIEAYNRAQAKELGTKLHDLADHRIRLEQQIPKEMLKNMNAYVRDAKAYKMKSEYKIYYSENCWGTADTLSFRGKVLRIHDLKTGSTPAHMDQLRIYAAMYCLARNLSPDDITIVLRIYQSNEIIEETANPDEILIIMDKIIEGDRIISEIKLMEKEE